jgi:hypothetical protein
MTEEELRQMVRESIARHAARGTERSDLRIEPSRGHASHATFALRSGDEDGACVIEPAVRCNRCGYCLSYGH